MCVAITEDTRRVATHLVESLKLVKDGIRRYHEMSCWDLAMRQKLSTIAPLWGQPPVTVEFPLQKINDVESVSLSFRHHDMHGALFINMG